MIECFGCVKGGTALMAIVLTGIVLFVMVDKETSFGEGLRTIPTRKCGWRCNVFGMASICVAKQIFYVPKCLRRCAMVAGVWLFVEMRTNVAFE